MSEVKIEPTCRYGHGPLAVVINNNQMPDYHDQWFGILGVKRDGSTDLWAANVLRAYKCQTCTYIELHDVPESEFVETVTATQKERDLAAQMNLKATLRALAEQDQLAEKPDGK